MRRLSLAVGACAIVACGEVPTGPDATTTEPTEPTVAAVGVSSPIGDAIVVSGSVTLAAAAQGAGGEQITTPITWASSDVDVAAVSASGVVTGVSPGEATIAASAGGMTGTLLLTVADADLVAIAALLDDPLADDLLTGIGGPREAGLRSAWVDCQAARAAGNLRALSACIDRARSELEGTPSLGTGPLQALVALFVDWIEDLLNL